MEENKVPFEELSLIKKINAIDDIIEEKIREYLQNDGEDIDLIDVRESRGGMTDVYISWLGACGSCESSGGTLASIERILNGQLETHTIRVHTV
jgi:NifU-like protein